MHRYYEGQTVKSRTSIEDWDEVPGTNPVAHDMQRIRRQTQLVCDGRLAAALIYGGPGTGKTHYIREGVRGANPIFLRPRGEDDIIHAFRLSAGGRPIVFEEADNVFNTVNMVNVMKVAMDIDGHREIQNRKHGKVRLNAPVLMASNRDLNDEMAFPREVREHVRAIRSRVSPIAVSKDTGALWEYSCYLAIRQGLIRKDDGGRTRSVKVQNMALEWFTTHAWRMDEVSPRRLKNVARMIGLYPDEPKLWESDLASMLVKSEDEVARMPAFPIPRIIVSPSTPSLSSANAA